MIFPFLKEATSNLFSRPSTENFPAVNVEAKPNYRGRIAYDPEKCVNCGECVKVCAPEAITRTYEDLGDGTRKGTYHFNLTSCTFCGTCQDFCSTNAITLTEDYHMVGDAADLFTEGSWIHEIITGKLFCGADCIFCGLCMKNCPEEAITGRPHYKIVKELVQWCKEEGLDIDHITPSQFDNILGEGTGIYFAGPEWRNEKSCRLSGPEGNSVFLS